MDNPGETERAMVEETDTRGQKCHFKISWDIETNSPFKY